MELSRIEEMEPRLPVLQRSNRRAGSPFLSLAQRLAVALGLILLASGCTAGGQRHVLSNSCEPSRTAYVVNRGWHSGLVVAYDDVPNEIWPEKEDFAGADYLEVGWGDERFFLAEQPTMGLTLRAMMLPTSSALRVREVERPIDGYLAEHDAIEVQLCDDGFRAMCRFIHENHARDAQGNAMRLVRGTEQDAGYYLGTRTYFLTNTCNVWTSQALRSAGISPLSSSFHTSSVLRQARRIGIGVP